MCKHWPQGFATTFVKGKLRPMDPSSIFIGIFHKVKFQNLLRNFDRPAFEVRNKKEDELHIFKEQDKLDWETACAFPLHLNRFEIPITLAHVLYFLYSI